MITDGSAALADRRTNSGTPPLRLLIIDDDAVDRLAVRRALGQTGLRNVIITEAADARAARTALAKTDPAVGCLILDYQLAGETGMDVLDHVRTHHADVPVIVLTGSGDPETAVALMKAGALDFLGKDGLTPTRLEQAIRAAIRVTRAEAEAQESGERLAATLRSIADAVLTVDRERRIVFMNAAAEQLTGWTSAEMMGQLIDDVAPAREVGPPPAADDNLGARALVVMGGTVDLQRVDMAMIDRHGVGLLVDVTAAPLLDGNGVVTGAVIAMRDITERRRAETEIEQSRLDADRARKDVETLNRVGNALAAELDLEKIVQTVTDAATTLTGAQFGAFFYNVTDRQGEKFTLYALSGAPREAFEDFGQPRATPIFAPTFHGTEIVRSDDITKDPRYGKMAPHHGMPPGHLPVRSYLAVPVFARSVRCWAD